MIGQCYQCILVIERQASGLASYRNNPIQGTTIKALPAQLLCQLVGDGPFP
jgi:hypothetical protein